MPRTPLLPLLLVSAVLVLGACDSADTPFEPAAEALIPDDQAPAPDLALATTAQRILFSSSRKGGYDLFKMDPQGYNVARMTSFANYETEPAWSQDNKRIAMTRPRLDASNVQHSDIYLMNADGTNKRWARSSPSSFDVRYPSWSPDGSQLVVNVMLGGKHYLATLKLATGAMAFVTLGGQILQGSYPSFDPTGKYIIYVGAGGKTIEMINPAGNTGYLMVSSTTFMSGPRLSPDGYKIAFAKVVGTNIDIFVHNTSTGVTKRLTTNAASDTEPTWSPDGSKIAFVSDRSGKSQIWTMNAAAGGSQTRITHTSTHEKNPVWSH
jgi:Tol biopolymer transport system component